MNEIDLRQFDLNLLVVFEVLMSERSVTRAAERLKRTQSAVSYSLARLRDQLDDPLLIKGGRRMQATAFAIDFMEQARPILQSIQRALSRRHAFDPTTSRRVFRLGAPDFAINLFTSLLVALRADAPGVAIEWTGPRETMLLDVAEGLTDIAIAPADLSLPDGVLGEAIGGLQWRCFARLDHPAFSDWGPAAWSRWPHLVVRVGDQLESPVNIAAAAAGVERTIAAWVPNFLAIAPVLCASDLLATLPALVLAGGLDRYGLETRNVPFSIHPINHALLWGAGRTNDPEIRWLRDKLRPIVKREFADLREPSPRHLVIAP
jgi:LysR family transcriptional regulator, mexEF-oprN operon transcriptional activator